jgi:hypothetical protein
MAGDRNDDNITHQVWQHDPETNKMVCVELAHKGVQYRLNENTQSLRILMMVDQSFLKDDGRSCSFTLAHLWNFYQVQRTSHESSGGYDVRHQNRIAQSSGPN